MMRFWSPASAPAGRMPGVTSTMPAPTMRAQLGRLLGRADQAVDADVARLRGALGDQLRHGEVVAGGGEIGVVVGGQHRDGEDAQARAFARVDRRMHGLRIGVHGEEASRRASPRSRRPCATVLPMSCSLRSRNTCLPAPISVSRKGEAAGEGELIADLVERHRVAEPRHHRLAPPRPTDTSSATIRRSRASCITVQLSRSARMSIEPRAPRA